MPINISYISHDATNRFSKLVLDYLGQDGGLLPFINNFPSLENIKSQINSRKDFPVDRSLLVSQLSATYASSSENEKVRNNINLLAQNNTFTITSAHQPIIFGGPLYFIYKILHTAVLADYLSKQLPEYNFVPIYYMGSEDADIEEIGKFNFRKTTYSWQPNLAGPAGRLPFDEMHAIVDKVTSQINDNTTNGQRIKEIISTAYYKHKTLSEATHYLVHELLGDFGVVILQPDNVLFKNSFKEKFKRELLEQISFPAVEKTSSELSEKYKVQAFARPINLFYAKGHSRNRIDKVGDVWQVIDTDIVFTEQELMQEVDQYPEHFSTNVITRGLYQEHLLPNIAFVGGGGELAYWTQLKNVFAAFQQTMPILILRQSIQNISEDDAATCSNLGLTITDLFGDKNIFFKRIASASLNADKMNLLRLAQDKILEDYQQLAKELGLPLQQSIEAHGKKMERIHRRLEQKFTAQAKKKENARIDSLEKLLEQTYLNKGLQERIENFIDYYIENGDDIFKNWYHAILPFGEKFALLSK